MRAIEWLNWPAFLSQLFAPILLVLLPWYYVAGGIVVAGVLWCSVRYKVVNVTLANLAAVVVTLLKWPIAIGSAAYLFLHDQKVVAAIALLWPVVAAFVGIPGKVGVVERNFGMRLGLSPANPNDYDCR